MSTASFSRSLEEPVGYIARPLDHYRDRVRGFNGRLIRFRRRIELGSGAIAGMDVRCGWRGGGDEDDRSIGGTCYGGNGRAFKQSPSDHANMAWVGQENQMKPREAFRGGNRVG